MAEIFFPRRIPSAEREFKLNDINREIKLISAVPEFSVQEGFRQETKKGKDLYGNGSLSGIAYDGDPPVTAKITAYWEAPDGRLILADTEEATVGGYSFNNLRAGEKFLIRGQKDDRRDQVSQSNIPNSAPVVSCDDFSVTIGEYKQTLIHVLPNTYSGEISFALSQDSDPLPDGLSIEKWCIVGTATGAPGEYPVEIVVTDDNGSTTIPITITSVLEDVEIIDDDFWFDYKYEVQNTKYRPGQYKLRARGGEGPYTWSLDAGDLPTGVTLDPEGFFIGKPSVDDEEYNFDLKATDIRGAVGVKSYIGSVNSGSRFWGFNWTRNNGQGYGTIQKLEFLDELGAPILNVPMTARYSSASDPIWAANSIFSQDNFNFAYGWAAGTTEEYSSQYCGANFYRNVEPRAIRITSRTNPSAVNQSPREFFIISSDGVTNSFVDQTNWTEAQSRTFSCFPEPASTPHKYWRIRARSVPFVYDPWHINKLTFDDNPHVGGSTINSGWNNADCLTGLYYYNASYVYSAGYGTNFIGYNFPSPVSIDSVTIHSAYNSYCPQHISVESSDDGVSWTEEWRGLNPKYVNSANPWTSFRNIQDPGHLPGQPARGWRIRWLTKEATEMAACNRLFFGGIIPSEGMAFSDSVYTASWSPYYSFISPWVSGSSWMSTNENAATAHPGPQYLGYVYNEPKTFDYFAFYSHNHPNERLRAPLSFVVESSANLKDWVTEWSDTTTSWIQAEHRVFTRPGASVRRYRLLSTNQQDNNYTEIGEFLVNGKESFATTASSFLNASYQPFYATTENGNLWISGNEAMPRSITTFIDESAYFFTIGVSNSTVARTPKKFKIQTSTDGTSWNDIVDADTPNWYNYEYRHFLVPGMGHKMWRIWFGTNNNTTVVVKKCEFNGQQYPEYPYFFSDCLDRNTWHGKHAWNNTENSWHTTSGSETRNKFTGKVLPNSLSVDSITLTPRQDYMANLPTSGIVQSSTDGENWTDEWSFSGPPASSYDPITFTKP